MWNTKQERTMSEIQKIKIKNNHEYAQGKHQWNVR